MLAAAPIHQSVATEPAAMTLRAGAARRRAPRAAALLLVLPLLLVAACSSPPPPAATTAQPASAVGADATRSRTAELQAGLTHLLVERVYETSAARTAADEAERDDAAAALDESAVALAGLLAASDTFARDPLVAALRAVDRRSLQQADAGDGPEAPAALDRLRTAQAELADTVGRVVPRLGAGLVRERLDGDLDAQLAVSGDDPYALLRLAAARAPDTARLLTGGIAEDRELGVFGTRAATLRAALTGTLTEHVLLAGALGHENDAGPDRRAGALRALQANGEQLTGQLATAYPSLATDFGPSWQRHVTRLAALAADPTEVQARRVVAYPPELGALLARHVDGLPARTTVVEVEPLLRAVAAAVRAAATGATEQHRVLRRAAGTAPAPGALLAAAIAQDRRYT